MAYYNTSITEIASLYQSSLSRVDYYFYYDVPDVPINQQFKALLMVISNDKTTYEYRVYNSTRYSKVSLNYTSIPSYNCTTPNIPYYFKYVAKPKDEDYTEEEIQHIFESDDFTEYKSYYGTQNLDINVRNNKEINLDYEFKINITPNNPIVDYYKIELWDYDGNVKLLESDEIRPANSSSTFATYVFDNLEEDTVYKVKLCCYPYDGLKFRLLWTYNICTGIFVFDDVFVSNITCYYSQYNSYSFTLDLDGNLNREMVCGGYYYSNDGDTYIDWTNSTVNNNKCTFRLYNTAIHPELIYPNTPYLISTIFVRKGYVFSWETVELAKKKQSNVVYYIEKPTLTLNIQNNDTIDTSGYTFILGYTQDDDEPIDYGIFYLYDANGNLLRESEKLFNIEDPPLILYKYFGGFLNNTSYKIKAYVKTFHGLEVETDLINFNIEYEDPILHAPLKLKSECDEGYIDVSSDIFVGEGESNPSPMVYINEGEKYSAYAIKSDPIIQYQRQTSSWIYWGYGVDINTSFVIKYWFSVGSINNDILRLYNEDGNYINVKFKRLNRTVAELNGDYIEVSSSENVIANSNIIHSRTNGTNKYFLWIKVVNNQWEVILREDSKEESVFNWDDSDNNISWNATSDITWYQENYEDNRLESPLYQFNPNNFNKILVGNGICRQLEITNDTSLVYSDELDDWNEYMVLKCDFDQNLKGGNLDEQLGNISSIRIKRMDSTNNSWITLYEKDINEEEDLMIDYHDYIVPKGVEQMYALVPVMANGDEGNYIVNTIVPNWRYCFVSDNEQCFKLYSSINYGSTPQNVPVGTLNPIGRTYPIIIRNSSVDYQSGVLSGQLMGYNFEQYHHLDRADVVKQTQDFVKFLTNGKSKVITDWNGNCWIVQVIDSPTINYNIATTNGIVTVTFSWAEQGKYNNEKDLIENDLI